VAELKPGDVRLFKEGYGASLAVAIGVWAKRDGKHIRIDITGLGGHTTVSNRPGMRYHRTLFRNLRRFLIKNGQWPFGDEGEETEQQ
jgi:hypothetical protein